LVPGLPVRPAIAFQQGAGFYREVIPMLKNSFGLAIHIVSALPEQDLPSLNP